MTHPRPKDPMSEPKDDYTPIGPAAASRLNTSGESIRISGEGGIEWRPAATEARIAELEAGLREACDLLDAYGCGDAGHLRALAKSK